MNLPIRKTQATIIKLMETSTYRYIPIPKPNSIQEPRIQTQIHQKQTPAPRTTHLQHWGKVNSPHLHTQVPR